MSSKKKLVISLSVAATVLVAAIIAIVAVFAAASQAVQSDIKVTFKATDVACGITGTWQVAGKEDAEHKVEFGSIAFAAKEGNEEAKTMSAEPNIALTSSENYIDFIYTFTNAGSRGFSIVLEEEVVATKVGEDQLTGVTVSYLVKRMGAEQAVAVNLGDLMGTGEKPSLVICEPGVAEEVSVIVRFTVQEESYELDSKFAANIAFKLDAIVNEGE